MRLIYKIFSVIIILIVFWIGYDFYRKNMTLRFKYVSKKEYKDFNKISYSVENNYYGKNQYKQIDLFIISLKEKLKNKIQNKELMIEFVNYDSIYFSPTSEYVNKEYNGEGFPEPPNWYQYYMNNIICFYFWDSNGKFKNKDYYRKGEFEKSIYIKGMDIK